MKTLRCLLALFAMFYLTCAVLADARSQMAKETAEFVAAKFGARMAGKSVPAIASRLESLAAKHGDEVFQAVRKAGPQAFELVEAAGVNGSKAARAMAVHGEAAATHVLRRPKAMEQFLTHGEQACAVLVRHPGVAERIVEQGGMSAVNALAKVTPRNGRRLGMLMEKELAKTGKSAEVLEVVAKYGDRATVWVWNNKGALATGTVLTAFLANPEPFLSSATEVTKAAGEHVAAPILGGFFTAVNTVLVVAGVAVFALIAGAVALMWKHGVPKPEAVKAAADVIRQK